ncbi:rod shape-determining protein MreC [uncultured Polaribacter sp.]|uniref:rod shape-determining protein MreC n=1 Tax=uncultured Polaribacter sp. TaxID=174711 RepID=UPI00261AAFF6|nr:rod shape-determining protein MreC [uncultured Polaribacter sp.]
MQQIIYFFQKFKYFLFFLFLEFIALTLIFNNLNFHKSKFINSANAITGGFYTKLANTSEYLHLKEDNQHLSEENKHLKNLLEQHKIVSSKDSIAIDSTLFFQKSVYSQAKIINNNYSKPFNFLTINKGKNQGVDKEMAIVNHKGIIGITESTSNNYTRVQSILNLNSEINARLKGKTSYYGTLKWDSKDYNIVQLHDIPRQAPLKIGDTIETGGKSTIFPEGIPIGSILKINQGNTAENKVDIQLFNDMSNLRYVYVVKNLDKIEIKSLENGTNE